MARTWSGLHNAIFDFVVNGEGHGVVIARAGCGKTTTLVEAVIRWLAANPGRQVTVCAFNKRIEEELVARFVGHPVTVKTLHAIGRAVVSRWWEGVRVNDPKKDPVSRKDALTQRVCGSAAPDAIKKLVSKLHTLAREIEPLAQWPHDLENLAIQFECEPDEDWQASGFDRGYVCARAIDAMKLAASEKPIVTGIDFADMIFLPVRNGWLAKTQDLVVVDEAQDMNLAKLKIARGICKGRMLIVGDDRQAIYSFVGARQETLAELTAELGATTLRLNTTYRCGTAIVALAAAMVPDFEAGPNNPAGRVSSLPEDKLAEAVQLGDFVLSRVNAPLVSTAIRLLRAGKRARVAGKQIGKDLQALVRRINKSARSVPEFLDRLAGWQGQQIARISKAGRSPEATERLIEEILDQADMIRNLADDARNVKEIEERIDALFTDDGLGQAGVVTCSSIHKAKGLEANQVFILADTLKNHTPEEENIRYVAITRAKLSLVWVGTNLAPGQVPEPKEEKR
jgi:superfamily I DNA/RNA helicase